MTDRGYRGLIGSFAALSFAMAVAAGTMLLFRPAPEDGAPATPGRFAPAGESRPVPALAFTDGAGHPASLADFKGKVVLLNLWATWCAPCVREMPSLDRLQAALGGADFQVVALAEDRGGGAVVLPFLEKLGLRSLSPYLDAPGAAAQAFGAPGLPTTVLIGRDGREAGRTLGAAEWDSPESRRMIDGLIAGKRG